MNKEQLDAIRKRIKQSKSSNWVSYMVINEDVPALIAEVERLHEALKFYADEENYRNISMAKLYSNIAADNGKKARQALGDGDE